MIDKGCSFYTDKCPKFWEMQSVKFFEDSSPNLLVRYLFQLFGRVLHNASLSLLELPMQSQLSSVQLTLKLLQLFLHVVVELILIEVPQFAFDGRRFG